MRETDFEHLHEPRFEPCAGALMERTPIRFQAAASFFTADFLSVAIDGLARRPFCVLGTDKRVGNRRTGQPTRKPDVDLDLIVHV